MARADRAGPMTTTHLLIILVPSLVAGLLWGRSLLTAAVWGVAAEVMGLIIVVLPISGAPRNNLSLMMICWRARLCVAFAQAFEVSPGSVKRERRTATTTAKRAQNSGIALAQ